MAGDSVTSSGLQRTDFLDPGDAIRVVDGSV
jgi:hypothetical protein